MTKRNRKETVEQEKHQSEEINNNNAEAIIEVNPQDEIIEPIQNGEIKSNSSSEESPISLAESKIAELNDKYLRLSAEFDNYRKRTMRERAELIKSAGEDILSNILPVLDNFDRALIAIRDSREPEAIKAGIDLIYIKFKEFLTQRGIKEIESLNKPFDADLFDAITKIPVSSIDQQGKVVDVVEKGYYLNDKIIRHSKVVVGEYTGPGTTGSNYQND